MRMSFRRACVVSAASNRLVGCPVRCTNEKEKNIPLLVVEKVMVVHV